MPNDFSIEIHNYLSARILEAERAAKSDDLDTAAHGRGRLEELQWIRRYLQENIDLKNYLYY